MYTEQPSGQRQLTPEEEREFDRNFKPRGAIAFFLLIVVLGIIIWYSVYFLMLERA